MEEGNDNNQKRGRKRQRHPETYKRNIIKEKILRGQEYVGHKGTLKRARAVSSPCRYLRIAILKHL